ncbi:MAG: hypothetical protein PHF56_24370 [Desulfuromonadaceae bacterium]|nr:hypothetical protein [Desulfuromonadaceae bacterium]
MNNLILEQDVDDPDPFRYSGFQYIFPYDRKPEANIHEELIGMKRVISDREYASLREWERWNEERALAGCYRYIFKTTSVGTGMQVDEIETNMSTDITDYDGW